MRFITAVGYVMLSVSVLCSFFFFQAEDGIRDLVRSRGLGDVYKRQPPRATPGSSTRSRSKKKTWLASMSSMS